MKYLIGFVVVGFVSLLIVPRAHAIIFIPAIVLIPVAKIIAVILAATSFPTFTFGTIYSKLFKKSTKRTLIVLFSLILIILAIVAIILKVTNPDRPIL